MHDKIEVYVKTEKKLAGQYTSAPISDGVMTHACLSKNVLQYEKALTEAEKCALEVVKRFAEKKGALVEVVDVSSFKGKLKARTRGVRKTPTVMFGQERIEEPDPERLPEKLESHFTHAHI